MVGRGSHRISIRIKVRFLCSDRLYSGIVTNISERGMFICTDEECLPQGSHFDLSIPLDKEFVNVPAKINRMVHMSEGRYGIGIELLDPPRKYLDYVENLSFLM